MPKLVRQRHSTTIPKPPAIPDSRRKHVPGDGDPVLVPLVLRPSGRRPSVPGPDGASVAGIQRRAGLCLRPVAEDVCLGAAHKHVDNVLFGQRSHLWETSGLLQAGEACYLLAWVACAILPVLETVEEQVGELLNIITHLQQLKPARGSKQQQPQTNTRVLKGLIYGEGAWWNSHVNASLVNAAIAQHELGVHVVMT